MLTLSERIVEAGLHARTARTFSEALQEVAGTDGPVSAVERDLIRQLVDSLWSPADTPAPFEALWSHAELFLTACVYVAVADGEYSVEEARMISLFAHRLGYSVRGLSALESRVFADLKARAAEEAPTIIRKRPTDFEWLRDSDSEIVIGRRKLE